jgi:signal transduction histidine kinase
MRTQLHIVAVEDGTADAETIALLLSNAGLRCVVRQVKTGPDFTSAPQKPAREDSRGDRELRRRLAALEGTVRIRTESLDQAIAQLHKETRLHQAAEMELGLARKLVTVGRPKAPADLNRAIETTLFVARNEYKHVATVQLHLGEMPEVICDIGELGQVFLNLIANSAHALADAGCDAQSGRIVIRTALVDDWAQLQFEDNGCGIPQANIDRIYDPFFTTKDVGCGSGLAIVRAVVVDRHSGRISVESTPGKGTCFTLLLPVGGPAADRW